MKIVEVSLKMIPYWKWFVFGGYRLALWALLRLALGRAGAWMVHR
ncbi:hypothetical protein ACFO5U_08725 [Planococcus dechangensis]|uniref:Uncharacterized protein n=1 Tax=Planococcus dechangensis TaxID=1176255 RepID=A0ABV9MAS1_9BACL